ncbi:hypothetical protein KAR91_59755 [Candidatus Pacearchaeota archaeon]|nr:hypothetical protein [Candidatus Pacearchaeota archaeon]
MNNENLIPPVKGEVRNPKGRPVGSRNRATVLRELYDMVVENKDLESVEKTMPVEVALMQALIAKGLEGDVSAIKEAQDTVYGKLVDKVKQEVTVVKMGDVVVTGEDGTAMSLEFDVGEQKKIDADK